MQWAVPIVAAWLVTCVAAASSTGKYVRVRCDAYSVASAASGSELQTNYK